MPSAKPAGPANGVARPADENAFRELIRTYGLVERVITRVVTPGTLTDTATVTASNVSFDPDDSATAIEQLVNEVEAELR